MASTISLRVKIYIESIRSELFRRVYVPDSFSIGDLIQSINSRLLSERIEGEIYFMFNEYQVDLVEESRLGGILFPEDVLLVRSMIENNSLLYVNGRIITPVASVSDTTATADSPSDTTATAASAAVAIPPPLENYDEDDEYDNEEEYEDELTRNISFQLLNLMQQSLGASAAVTNVNGSNVLELNIHDLARTSEMDSFLDVFSVATNLNGPVAVAPPIDILTTTMNTANLLSSFLSIIQGAAPLPSAYTDIVVGLDKNDLDKLKVDTYINFADTSRDTCSVCIDKFVPDDTCRELVCQHLFHKDCIDHWLDDNISCPVCRTECGKGIPKL
jgi:hypothetical protein